MCKQHEGIDGMEQTHRDDMARAIRAIPKPEGTRIEKLRWVVDNHQASRIEGKLVDATTAGMLVKVHDALSEENRAKFVALRLPQMVDLGWKLCRPR